MPLTARHCDCCCCTFYATQHCCNVECRQNFRQASHVAAGSRQSCNPWTPSLFHTVFTCYKGRQHKRFQRCPALVCQRHTQNNFIAQLYKNIARQSLAPLPNLTQEPRSLQKVLAHTSRVCFPLRQHYNASHSSKLSNCQPPCSSSSNSAPSPSFSSLAATPASPSRSRQLRLCSARG